MSSKYVKHLILIGIFLAFLNNGFAQQDIKRILCEGVQENKYIRNVSDCRIWIRCKGANLPSTGFCPDTYYFSEELQLCTSRERANCFVCPDTTSLSFEIVESSCNRYIRCVKGVPSEQVCDSGLQFNRNTKSCAFPSSQTCGPNNNLSTSAIVMTTTDISTTDTSTSIPHTSSPVTPKPVTPSPVTTSTVTPSPVTTSTVGQSPVTTSTVTPSPVTTSTVTQSPVTPRPVTPSPSTTFDTTEF